MKKSFYSLFTLVAITAIMFSCGKDPLPPVVQMFAEPDADNPYIINFTTTVENVTSYAWDFGDGETSTEANPKHTYAMSGDYTAKVTVTGEGGTAEATKAITIAASLKEMLSGGPGAANGKIWVLSRTATPGMDGAGAIETNFPTDIMPATDNMLDIIGLGDEYDNEYTFYFDGTYKVNNKDGESLAGWLYSADVIGMDKVVATTPYGIFKVSRTNTSSATWDLFEDTDLSIDVVDESDASEKTVTFEGADYITFGGGGYIGIEDYYTSIIVRDITADRMVVTVFMHSYEPIPTKPSIQLTMTLDAK